MESLLKYDESESLIKSTPNGKSGGIDGVSYKDLKDSCDDYYQYNKCNVNQSSFIKLLERGCYTKNSEQNFTIEDLSTLPGILLLPVCYKILSKAICNKIIPIISSKIDFWQQGFLNKRDRQELIYPLKTAFDDFRHKSTKFTSVFIDFADAFGSVNHQFLFETLQYFDIPDISITV